MPVVTVTQFESVRATFANIGVRQFGDPVLRRVAKPLRLPHERALASEVLLCLSETIKSARKLHDFSRGIGLAAPQIGISRRVAIVHPLGEAQIRMVNPRILTASRETSVDFEGCLSFFDVRGEVERPMEVTIEYQDGRGGIHQTHLAGDSARLALHEIDHLDGRLYVDLMPPERELIEADESLP